MARFNLDEYETVEERLKKFWADHPEGSVSSDVIHYSDNRIVIQARVSTQAGDITEPYAMGIAEETRGAGFVNKEAHVENCETSAIGRALANLNYATKKRPSREEMKKVGKTPLTTSQRDHLIKLAIDSGMDEEEAAAKADAMDGRLYDAAVKQLTQKG